MAVIQLRGKYANVPIHIDDEDSDLTALPWYGLMTQTGHFYAKNKQGYLHRIIADRFLPLDASKPLVDHANRVTTDCRRGNLRRADQTENLRNRTSANRSTLFKGISQQSGKYLANICVDYERHYLGRYKRLFDAVVAYDTEAKILHGEFASTNGDNMTPEMLDALVKEAVSELDVT